MENTIVQTGRNIAISVATAAVDCTTCAGIAAAIGATLSVGTVIAIAIGSSAVAYTALRLVQAS